MKVKEKPCKGIGKAKDFKGCGEMRLHRTYGLGHVCGCYRKWLFNTDEGKAKMTRTILKATEASRSLEDAEKKHHETKGIATALDTTKTCVHEMVRLRDEGKPCISCGCQWNSDFQAGHCFPTRYRSIRFNFFNINGQCVGCNIGKDGNETQYLLKLPLRIGKDIFENLKSLALEDGKFNKHWTRDELSEIRKQARVIIKRLK